MKRKHFKFIGMSFTLPNKMFKELVGIYKLIIELLGYDEMEKRFPFMFSCFLRFYEKGTKNR